MLSQVESLFPDEVDPVIFFQDVNLDTVGLKTTYDALIEAGSYTEASEYAGGQSELYGYWARYLNAIENRIYATQEYVLSEDEDTTTVITEHTSYDEEPDVPIPTHEDLEDYTQEELEEFLQGYLSEDPYIWITDDE